MPRKQNQPDSTAKSSRKKDSVEKVLPRVAQMKFWSQFRNPKPALYFPSHDDFEDDCDHELEELIRIAEIPVTDDSNSVFQLKISLDDSVPPVWRRVQSENVSLDVLHRIIQSAMGWDDSHLHIFEVAESFVPMIEEGAELDERQLSLAHLSAAKKSKFYYQYDFGDDWQHTIKIEKRLKKKEGSEYPCCIDGAGICPIEDCGGIDLWSHFVQQLNDPEYERDEWFNETLGRVGQDFMANAFCLDDVNKRLKAEFKKRTRRKRRTSAD